MKESELRLMVYNTPEIWLADFPRPSLTGHKYDRGQAVIYGAPSLTGATRLAAGACSRIGAGLVTVLARDNGDIFRATLDADIMVSDAQTINGGRIKVILGGSGGIVDADYRALMENRYGCARVFDADALPLAQDFEKLDEQCVLTPHDGEFARTFPKLSGRHLSGRHLSGDRVEMALEAAKITGSVMVLKGAQTIIARPDGRWVMNEHASAYLAKAGTGDVLAGLITGLIAQGMPIFEACCAAVWMHGEAGIRFGAGLIATDIIDLMPAILSDILN